MKQRRVLFICFLFFFFLFFASNIYSDSVRISQIDNSSLLINQKVKVYLSVTDREGSPISNLEKENFIVYEFEEQKEIHQFQRGVNVQKGINLLLVLDNSGSMYWDGSGEIKNSNDESIWRITYAKEAITSLLNEIKNPRDRVGLISFNVKLDSKVRMTDDKVEIVRVLENVKKPKEEEAYTELYETLHESVDYLRVLKGRKVIVVLSDGQDFPLEQNPHFIKRYGMDGAIDFAQQEGVSIFTIGLSTKADRKNLRKIAEETGGAYFSVYDPKKLKNLYTLIRDQILNEYLITYSAGMEPSERKPVKIIYMNQDKKAEANRYYFSGTIFGYGQEKINYLAFILIPVVFALVWLISLMKFEQKRETPSLTVFKPGGRKTIVHSLPVTRAQSEMTIGGRASSDITIAGDPSLKHTEVKIVNKKGVYTLSGGKAQVKVNNKPVKTKVLRPGDLIQIGNSTVVFDEGVKRAFGEKGKGKIESSRKQEKKSSKGKKR